MISKYAVIGCGIGIIALALNFAYTFWTDQDFVALGKRCFGQILVIGSYELANAISYHRFLWLLLFLPAIVALNTAYDIWIGWDERRNLARSTIHLLAVALCAVFNNMVLIVS